MLEKTITRYWRAPKGLVLAFGLTLLLLVLAVTTVLSLQTGLFQQ